MPQDADEYYVFTDEKYPIQPPTNGRIKELTRLQLRAPHAASLSEKKQMARSFGWDPTDVIPGHSREETVERGGEEDTVVRDNDLGRLTLPEYFARAAEVVLRDCDTEGRVDEVRVDEVQDALQDFTERGFGMSAASRS